ncbi:MAG: LysM peptidoglycan-binding domain-containing protein [Rikenellaceae bacterium]|nr:LysM peptidoglycan-binding domain-containing protein [Rikenellaceae bacterium]
MAGGKFKATYITEQEFMDNYIYGFPHRFYEGFIIGVGYAYVACRMEHPPHQHGFSCCPDIHPEDNIYRTLHYQQIDNSPEMKELSLRGRESGEFTEIRVMVGDTLGGLAREFGVTVEDMVRWNKLDDPDKIIDGQSMIVKTDD